jgi:hypothetical protein
LNCGASVSIFAKSPAHQHTRTVGGNETWQMKIIYTILLLMPTLVYGQRSISYKEGLDNCQRIIDENKRVNPDTFIYTGPECLIGARVPEFSAITIDGKEISPEYFTGKITVLNFWFLGCPPCLAETPGFNKVA